MKVLDCPFHEMNFFKKLQELIFQEYVLQTLLERSRGSVYSKKSTLTAQLNRIKGACDDILLLLFRRLHTICDALANCNFDDDHQFETVISLLFRNLTNNEAR